MEVTYIFFVNTANTLCQLHGRMIFLLHYCSLLPCALNAAYQQQEEYRNSFSCSFSFVTSNSRLNIFIYDVSPFTIRTERTLPSQGQRRKFLGVTCTFFSIRSYRTLTASSHKRMIIIILISKLNILYVCVFLFPIRTARTLASS